MAEPRSSVRNYPESGLESTTESEEGVNTNIAEGLTKTSVRGVDLFEPFQVKATADLNVFESDDEESQGRSKVCVSNNVLTKCNADKNAKSVQRNNHLDEKQRRAHGVYIDIRACLKTLCHGRVPIQCSSEGTEVPDCTAHLLISYKSMRNISSQHQLYSPLKHESHAPGIAPEVGLGLAAACKGSRKVLTEKSDSLPNEQENDFRLRIVSNETVIPYPGPPIDCADDDGAERSPGITGSQEMLVPAVAGLRSQSNQNLDGVPSLQNIASHAQPQAIDGVLLPPPLENAWYFRFTSTGDFKTPMDYAIDKLTLRTCSYTYSAMCGTKSLLFNYYVAGDTSYDPVLIIPDFYQSSLCVAPLINLLIKKKKCAYILDISTIASRLMTHEIIVCYTEFILNVCLHFRTAGRRRSSTVGMGIQETARKISLIGQGSGANIALKLAIAVTILSDGLDTLYTYDFARLVTARLMRDGMSSVNLTTMLSVRSVILCNPHLPTFETVLRNKNATMSKLIKQPRTVNANRSNLLRALGYETGMIADSKMPVSAFPNFNSSSSQTPASVKPNYLSFCPQELLDFYKKQIASYNKAMFLSMSILGRVSVPIEDMDGPIPNVFEMYAGLTPLHRSSFPLNIFLGSDYNLFSGGDMNLLASLGDDNTTVLLRTIPGCGADMLNTCKDILCHML